MMAVASEYLKQLISKQVDDRGLVVWYDPDRSYEELAREIAFPETQVILYDGSFLHLRKQVDPLLKGSQPPRLVVYIPLEREKTHSALIELDCAGVIMQPRQQPLACNTRLSVIARSVLRPILGEDQVAEIERQVESGKLTLADLDSMAEQGMDISTGVVKLVFGTANPLDVALAFLQGDTLDAAILKKEAGNELSRLLQLHLDLQLPQEFGDWRSHLGRHVLTTEMARALGESFPVSLAGVPVAKSSVGVESCIRLAKSWRNSREHRDSYVSHASKVEKELNLTSQGLVADQLSTLETFPCFERILLESAEQDLLKEPGTTQRDLASSRLSSFWSEVNPAIQARWALIHSAAQVLLESERISKEVKKAPAALASLVKRYAEGDDAWCLLDTFHRHLESRKYRFEFSSSLEHEGLERLVAQAEERYTKVGSTLAKVFVAQLAKEKHPVPGIGRQREIFEKHVRPYLGDAKVAYVWVDALRHEMARELRRLLEADFETVLEPVLATPPTVTEIGMASLLPKAHESLKVIGVGSGKLALEINGKVIKDRKDRVAYLKENAGVSVFDAKLEDLLPKPNKKVRDGILANQLILITSQEIDELGEADNMAQARLQIDEVLSQLRRGVRVLADHGVKTIVLVADHGHIFAEEMGEDMKIDPPGGKEEDLHRRAWIGVGGTTDPAYLRTPLASLGVDSEFDIATPWTFAVFRAKGGGRAYFHGGLSPQELIVPVMRLEAKKKSGPAAGNLSLIMTPGTPKLSTRFFSVQISGGQSMAGLFGFDPPVVKVEIRANKKCVSTPVSASYGFEDATGEIRLKVSEKNPKMIETNTVALMITEEISQKTVSVCLLDAVTGAELAAPLSLDVAISM